MMRGPPLGDFKRALSGAVERFGPPPHMTHLRHSEIQENSLRIAKQSIIAQAEIELERREEEDEDEDDEKKSHITSRSSQY